MGRRSINTTKSGKYMNPTDQARKEARKKELKKNKKQRQMVRAAVLKNKDPGQIIEEMEKIDEMEYNVYQPSPLNEKVLREKRKKLKETFDRVMRLYHNDDPEQWAELKRKEVEYEKRRNKKVQFFESVKHAQSVQVDEIPLPQMNDLPTLPKIPLPQPQIQIPIYIPNPSQGILKKQQHTMEVDIESEKQKSNLKKLPSGPPGPPPGPPPNLLTMMELDSDYEEEPTPKKLKSIRFSDENDKTPEELLQLTKEEILKPTSLQQRMLALSGQNIDEFMKEMENVQKKKEQIKYLSEKSDLLERLEKPDKNKENLDDEEDGDDDSSSDEENDRPVKEIIPVPKLSVSLPPPPPVGMPPGMMFRPPPLRPGLPNLSHMRMPPGPPPSGRPGPPPNMGPRLGIRMPPGPPPGMPPPRMMHQSNHQKLQHNQQSSNSGGGGNILSAGPQINKEKGAMVISAKPQIRNLSADIVRFVPSALRVKRDEKPKSKPKQMIPTAVRHVEQPQRPTKDDAYMQFMSEMQGLL